MNLAYLNSHDLNSHDLNFSNRLVWTCMPSGVAGAWLIAAPYADQEKIVLGNFLRPPTLLIPIATLLLCGFF